MNEKKYTDNKDEAPMKKVVFCAECGEELNLFGIDKINLEKVKERYHNCKESGKFKGDKCAMLFIAEENEDFIQPDEAD
jgi:hypothetical protein